ncbi:MAG: preprotein translocase subunit SecE [Planctomycetaceae bacterium]
MSRGIEETSFLGNLFSGSMFKRNQGRLVRRLTAIAIAAVVLYGCWSLSGWIENSPTTSGLSRNLQMLIPTAIALAGMWFAFRVVNYPPFANFLVSVEAEMDKVSWADWDYLKRAAAVVLCMMVFLGFVLALYDFLWVSLFTAIGILDPGGPSASPPGG